MPAFSPEQTQVNPGPLNAPNFNVSATPQAFGVGVGQSIEQGAEVADRIHYQAVQQWNQVSSMDAFNKYENAIQDKIYDGQNGLIHQNLGAKAIGAVQDTMSDLKDQSSKIADGLANDQQKMMFQKMTQDRNLQLKQHLNEYENRQINDYGAEVTKATIANASRMAVQNVSSIANSMDPKLQDPDARASAFNKAYSDPHAESGVDRSALGLGIAALHDDMDRTNPGWKNDPNLVAVMDAKVAAYKSATAYGIITSLGAQGKDIDAERFYNNHKGDLIGEEAVHAAHQTEMGSRIGEATGIMRELQNKQNKDGTPLSNEQMEAEIDGDKRIIADPRLQEAVYRQFNMYSHRQTLIHNEQQKQYNNDIGNSLESNGGDIEMTKQQNPHGWEMLDATGKAAWEGRAKQIRDRSLESNGGPAFMAAMKIAHSNSVNPDSEDGKSYAESFKAYTPSQIAALTVKMSATDKEKTIAAWEAAKSGSSTPDTATHKMFTDAADAKLSEKELPLESVTKIAGTGKATFNAITDRVRSQAWLEVDSWRKTHNNEDPPQTVIDQALDHSLLQNADKDYAVMALPKGHIFHPTQGDPEILRQARQNLLFRKKAGETTGDVINDESMVTEYNRIMTNKSEPMPTATFVSRPNRIYPEGIFIEDSAQNAKDAAALEAKKQQLRSKRINNE